jgi:hypothetical protein
MAERAYVLGGIVQYDEPRWEPLERAVGEDLAGWFMWMFEVQTTEHRRFQAYKHSGTRQYLNVDHQGNAYDYVGEEGGRDRYAPIPLAEAIELALASWERLGASSEDLADARAAIERARRGGRDGGEGGEGGER